MKQLILHNMIFIGLILASGVLQAATIVYVPLGSGNQVVKIDADTDSIIAS